LAIGDLALFWAEIDLSPDTHQSRTLRFNPLAKLPPELNERRNLISPADVR
jgi:hypothetical protein